jgi:hypothetical protein
MVVNNCNIEHVAIDEYQLIEQTSVLKILEWLDKSK